jgi:hypothetical protein
MRAKFEVQSVKRTTWGREAVAVAVYSGNAEDNQFAAATPTGKLEITVTNPAAMDFLEPGKSYYLDFTPADA